MQLRRFSQFKEQFQSLSSLFSFPNQVVSSERTKLQWLIRLRWMAIGLFFVMVLPALQYGFLNRYSVSIYLGILGILFVFNLISQLWVGESSTVFGPLTIGLQLAFDLLLLTLLLATARGFENPFVALFLLNTSLGAVLIEGRFSKPFLVLTHGLVGLLQVQYIRTHPQSHFADMIATMIVCHILILAFWIVMRSLGNYLDRENTRISQARVTAEKQDRLRAVGALAAGFSHEFASPLNSAKIRIERALRNQNSEDLEEAYMAVKACENVIHRMNASQMDKRDFQFHSVVMADILKDVADSWHEEHPEAKLSLSLEPETECEIPPLNLAQVTLNLLDNAYESNPHGKINLHFSSTEVELKVVVRDAGAGFSAAVLQRLDEPFVTTKSNGTGLGLYVSQLFAQSLGGELKVRNLEVGAEVSIEWPRSQRVR